MQAIHGGQAKNDQIDAQKMAVLLRGGMRPQASVYPAAMRATRDLLRRRTHLRRKRAERLAHLQQTTSQYHLPEIGKKLAYQANRDGVAERFPDPAVQKSIAVALALINHYDRRLTALELALVKTAKADHAQTFSRLRSIPGIGKSLALVLVDAIHEIHRCPRVQAFVSDGRLVKSANESAGTRDGTAGKKMGNADLKWACSAAAVRFLRTNPAGQKDLARLPKQQRKGKALTVLAHKVARAVYDRLKRETAFELDTVLHEEGVERVSLTPHGPPRGSAGMWRSGFDDPRRRGTPRSASACIPEPWPVIGRSRQLRQRQ
jgi:transposase